MVVKSDSHCLKPRLDECLQSGNLDMDKFIQTRKLELDKAIQPHILSLRHSSDPACRGISRCQCLGRSLFLGLELHPQPSERFLSNALDRIRGSFGTRSHRGWIRRLSLELAHRILRNAPRPSNPAARFLLDSDQATLAESVGHNRRRSDLPHPGMVLEREASSKRETEQGSEGIRSPCLVVGGN